MTAFVKNSMAHSAFCTLYAEQGDKKMRIMIAASRTGYSFTKRCSFLI